MADVPLIAFYGDDFTGSTDALECLALAGLKSILFVDVPSPDVLARFEGLEAVGIAGNSRSLTPEEMDAVIPDALDALARSGAPILHYKVCSTFDSSPTIGSIGRVMDLARGGLGSGTIPIVVGAPKLGRHSLFGTLFARHNVDGTVHRLDRHPTMSVHPTTPMREADMRGHIGAQTAQAIALLPAPEISGSPGQASAALEAALAGEPEALLIDLLDEAARAAGRRDPGGHGREDGAAVRGRLVGGRVRAGGTLAESGPSPGRATAHGRRAGRAHLRHLR
jgi:3-oxoisoapionate kinase